MANIWDPQRQVWVDDQTGNTYKPTDVGGDGIWHSPDGRSYINGVWTAPAGQQQTLPVGQPQVSGANGAFQGIPGYGYTVNQQQNQATSQLHSQDNAAQAQMQAAHDQSAMAIAQLQAQVQQEVAKGNNASAERIAQLNFQIATEQNRLQALQTQINQAAEARQERQLQANLAANPQDFVAYEYYKRMLGNPSTLGVVTGQPNATTPTSQPGSQQQTPAFSGYTPDPNAKGPVGTGANTGRDQYYANGGDNQPNGGLNTSGDYIATPQTANSPGQMLNGGSYTAAPPAYSDNSLASIANAIQNPGNQQWNPNLSGVGAFGANINAPNQLGRADYSNLSDSEKSILTSFLNAGINMGGKQVSIDPGDYFAQMQKSWIPTLAGGTGVNTQYQE